MCNDYIEWASRRFGKAEIPRLFYVPCLLSHIIILAQEIWFGGIAILLAGLLYSSFDLSAFYFKAFFAFCSLHFPPPVSLLPFSLPVFAPSFNLSYEKCLVMKSSAQVLGLRRCILGVLVYISLYERSCLRKKRFAFYIVQISCNLISLVFAVGWSVVDGRKEEERNTYDVFTCFFLILLLGGLARGMTSLVWVRVHVGFNEFQIFF